MLTAVVLYAGAAFCFLLAYAQPDRAAVLPPLLYAALLLLLLFPGPLLYRDTRWFFGQTLWRVATPLRGVTWSVPLLLVVAKSQRARGFSSFAASLVLSGLADAARNPHHHHHPTPPTTTTRCCRSDFLLADILTSLAKAVSDTERAVCHLAIGPIMQPHLKVSTGSVAAAVCVQAREVQGDDGAMRLACTAMQQAYTGGALFAASLATEEKQHRRPKYSL